MKTTRLSEPQISALYKIFRGRVIVQYGNIEATENDKKPISDNTLISLEERGLVKDTNRPTHKASLTPFAKQLVGGLFF